MIATGGAMGLVGRAHEMGLQPEVPALDLEALKARIAAIEDRLEGDTCRLLTSQGVRILTGTGRLVGPHQIVVDTADGQVDIEADAVLLSTGSRPRIPD